MKPSVNANLWSEESLFCKARLYIERMESHTADDWQYGFWSALTLELLARAALSHISPVLLADGKNWKNLTYALDKDRVAANFSPKSISTREVLTRLTALIHEFNSEIYGFCVRHSERRNSELHSGELAFEDSETSEWLPKFFFACDVLLGSMNRELEVFLSDPATARKMISDFKDVAANTVKKDIEAHKQLWSKKPKNEQEKASIQATAWATRHAGHRVKCPSCHSDALVQGTPSGPVTTEMDEDKVVQKQTVFPSSFQCIACELHISGLSKLSASGLGSTFSAKHSYTVAEFFGLYTEDDLEDARHEMPEYEPDFNEY